MMRLVRDCSVFTLIFLLGIAAAWAQLATAQLNGRVTDSSGAVLPGATVTMTQTATGLVRDAVTDGTGSYLISNLPTGPYRLEVSLQGFRSYVQTGLVLQVGATPTVNAVLSLGSIERAKSMYPGTMSRRRSKRGARANTRSKAVAIASSLPAFCSATASSISA